MGRDPDFLLAPAKRVPQLEEVGRGQTNTHGRDGTWDMKDIVVSGRLEGVTGRGAGGGGLKLQQAVLPEQVPGSAHELVDDGVGPVVRGVDQCPTLGVGRRVQHSG